ncbi:MAG: ribosome biogenesis GTPase Der, partial [Candidatus Nomurabacteria bacterium]|nr:ribosome biogenesis GTPase Der [Candidatus Nomurabacteria bacterium]
MTKKLPIVAIIGQTNAGKSALFNRLVGRKEAIVAREAGTTRDSVVRIVEPTSSQRATNAPFILVDTAGLKDPEDDFEATVQDQIADAVDSADLILVVKDRTEYPTADDRQIAKTALRSKKPVILVLNKSDLKEKLPASEFLKLGIKDIFETSAEHNKGINSLREGIIMSLNQAEELAKGQVRSSSQRTLGVAGASASPTAVWRSRSPLERASDLSSRAGLVKIALIGRPNVGKSHLFNALAGKQQAIVAPVAGTTRDINRLMIKYHGQNIELLDTAGVRRRGKIEQGIEKFSILRTTAAIEESDICLLLMDVGELNTSVDLSLAGMIAEASKGIIVVITKWDSVEDGDADAILTEMRRELDFIPYAPVIFTSSITGKNLPKIFELATDINQRRRQQIPTRKLNDVLQKAVAAHPPAGLKNTHPKFRY